MGVANHTESASVGGRIHQRSVDKSADNDIIIGGTSSPVTLITPSAVTSWVKTDADTAAGDVSAGSVIPAGVSVVDVWWDDGLRYGVDCTRTSNSLALDGGTGDAFPESADVTVVVAEQQQINVALDGDLAAVVSILSTVPAHIDFQDADDDSIRAVELVANEPDMWDSDQASNPYTGDPIVKAMVTNGTLAWLTSTSYAVGDVVSHSGTFYKCATAHTSGTFSTALASGYWTAISATLEILINQDSTP